jgi:hypothetical protein
VLFSGTVRENLFLGFADLDAAGPEPQAQHQQVLICGLAWDSVVGMAGSVGRH